MKKILWLSRHNLTMEQLSALKAESLGNDLEVVHLNVTFPALGWEAADMIRDLLQQHGACHVAGVFPAHVACALVACAKDTHTLWVPVSVPAPAVEGETRGGGFVFSHWEKFYI